MSPATSTLPPPTPGSSTRRRRPRPRLPDRLGELHRRRVGRGLRDGRPRAAPTATAPAAGVASVEVSIRRGTGDYWDGSGFSSSTEVWNDADLAGRRLVVRPRRLRLPRRRRLHCPRPGAATTSATPKPLRAGRSRSTRPTPPRPSSFPAAAGIYNPAGWDAGCPAPGLCGTYFDGTSGVAQVEISIQYDGGDYWDGSGFSSSTEVWNDADLAAGDWSYDFDASNLPVDGEYAVRVRARDGAGNTETPSSRTFTFDASEPETTIDSSMADPTNSTSASFDFSADEPGATFECALDGGAWSACTSPKAYTGLTDGGHTFEVRATDPAGNTDGNPAAFNWTIDTVDPTSTATFPAASGSYTAAEWDAGCTPAGLCGTYSDAGTGVVDVEVSIRRGTGNYWDGSGFSSATEVWNDATLAGGDWTYDFEAGRLPGRRQLHGAAARARRRRQHADALEPDVRLRRRRRRPRRSPSPPPRARTTPPAGTRAAPPTGSAAPTPTRTSGVAEVEVSIRRGTGNYWNGTGFSSATEVWNDATLAAGDWTYGFDSSDFPADGTYTVRVRATDVAGNTESASSRTFTYDTTAPQTTIDSSPTDPTGSNGASFDFSSNEGGSTFECRLDGGAWSACTSPKSYTEPGRRQPHLRRARHRLAGNTDASPASSTWLVDTTAPSSTTSFPAAGGEYNAAGWDDGCATSGLCGTYGDGSGSGVAEVEVSIRRGTGNYWNGTGFSSATEVWNDASLAAGELVVRLRLLRLPRRRHLHRARPRDRRRRQRRDAVHPRLRVRHDRPERALRLPRRRRRVPHVRLERRLRHRRLLRPAVRLGHRRRRRSRSPSSASPTTSTGTATPSTRAPRAGSRRLSPAATGRTRSRRRTSRPTGSTSSTCARPTTPATPRPGPPAPSGSTTPTRARSSPSRPRARATRPRAGTPAARRAASAARSPTPARASPRSRSA